MIALSTIKRSVIYNNLVLLSVFTIPLSQFVSIRLLVICCLLSLFVKNEQNNLGRLFKNSWDLGLYLLVLLIGLIYSANVTAGLRVLESNLGFLAIAIAFNKLENEDGRLLNKVYYSFAMGLTLACLICFINAVAVFATTGNLESFLFYNLTDILYFQPTYFAYYLIFVITYGLYLIYYQGTTRYLLAKAIVILFLFFVLMLTGGQTAFVSMLLIFSFFILKFIVEEKSKIKNITIILVSLMVICMFIATLMGKGKNSSLFNDAWDRLILWESAIEATPNIYIGVGTGDYKATLNEYYINHNLQKFANESYNSHNQFIQSLFSNGLIGILSLSLLIGRPLYLSSKTHNLIGVLLVFPFLIYGMTEVFLGRYQGVIFFALVHQLCILHIEPERFIALQKRTSFV